MKKSNGNVKKIIAFILCAAMASVGVLAVVLFKNSKKPQVPEPPAAVNQLDIDIASKQEEINKTMKSLLDLETSGKIRDQKLEEYATLVGVMQKHIYDLNTLIARVQAADAAKAEKIIELEEAKGKLLQAVNAYQQLLDSIPIIEDRFIVTFMFDNLPYAIVVLPDEALLDISAPESTDFVIFLGWSLTQDGELVDISNLTVTEDTVLFAVLTRLPRIYNVTFTDRGNVLGMRNINYGECATPPAVPPRDGYTFIGWALNGSIVTVSQYRIIEHTEFVAMWSTWTWQTVWSGDTQYNIKSGGGTVYIPLSSSLVPPNLLTSVGIGRIRIQYRTTNTNGIPVTETLILENRGYLSGGSALDNNDQLVRPLVYDFYITSLTVYIPVGAPAIFSTVTFRLFSISVLQ